MATSTIAGVRTTDYVGLTTNIKRDVYDAIYNFKPYQTPVTQFMFAGKKAKMPCYSPKFEIVEDLLMPHRTTTSSVAAQATDQAITVPAGEGLYFKVGDVIRIHATNENALVTASASTTINFLPLDGSGGTSFTAVAVSTVISRVGYAGAEASTSPVAKSTVASQPYNYTQIFKQSVNLSGTEMSTEMYGGDDWTNQRVKATEELKLDFERTWLYGIRNVTTTAGAYLRFTGGMLDQTSGAMGITDKTQYVGNAFATEDEFFTTYLPALFAKGTNRKTLYCGSDAIAAINNYSKVKQQTRVSEREYGVNIVNIITPFGEVGVVWNPILEGSYSNWCAGVDKDDYMKFRYLGANGRSRDLSFHQNVQTPDDDERKDYYLAEIGFHLAGGSQGAHRLLYPGA